MSVVTVQGKIDYPRLWSYERRHHLRFKAFVKNRKLICQDCRGSGGELVPILDDGTGPFEECGFCEGTGYVTPHMRGQWLRWKAQEKRERFA